MSGTGGSLFIGPDLHPKRRDRHRLGFLSQRVQPQRRSASALPLVRHSYCRTTRRGMVEAQAEGFALILKSVLTFWTHE